MADVLKSLDASGLACPMPVVRTKMTMDTLSPGEVLEVISTDRGSCTDIPAWCESTGNPLKEQREDAGRYIFLIEKG